MRQTFRRGVGAMGGGKGVVDVEIAQLGHGGGERGVVLFLARMETGVVEDGDIARTHRRDGGLGPLPLAILDEARSEEHTSELQSLMRISYAVFCLKKKK